MIIGHGDIASVLTDREGFTFFAAGVSNSREDRESEYRRERELLASVEKNTHLVYFSSLCVFYLGTPYAVHKRTQEIYVRTKFARWTIIRLGNITWGTNIHTIINHFRECRRKNVPLDVQDTYRYVVDLGEFLHWVNMIPEWSCEMNITGRRMSVRQIIDELV